MKDRSRFSLAGKVALLVGVHVLAAASAAAAVAFFLPDPLAVLAGGLAAGTVLALFTVTRSLASARRTLAALTDGVRSFRDTDFSMRLHATRRDELGELAALYNEMGDALRAERHDLYQRELLLDTVLQGAPVGIILEDRSGRVVYGNRAARDLLGAKTRLEGRLLRDVLEDCRRELREALAAPADVLFTVGGEGEEETYRTARRVFHLNMQPNVLHLVERLTPELRRQEVEVWKRAIRVMSHELNNSLAPIRSLSHSARQAAGRPEHAQLLEGILATIEERATHLAAFLEGYARFARLPHPRPQPVDWREFLEGVHAMNPFQLGGTPPAEPGWFDPVQMQQVLINLLKNAQESGSPPEEVGVSVHLTAQDESVLRVVDRGRGLDPSVMKRALLPFHSSTKQAGSGVGLALCREIVEAHGGRIRLENREGGGLAVTCWLPAGPPGRASTPDRAGAGVPAGESSANFRDPSCVTTTERPVNQGPGSGISGDKGRRESTVKTALAVVGLLAASANARAGMWDCDHKGPREAAVDAGGARLVRVIARAGDLKVHGRDGASSVAIRGTACASSEARLADIKLVAERRGDVVHVEAVIPEDGWWGGQGGLDLDIEVPASIALDVDDGSGAAQVRHVASLAIEDGSGDLLIEAVSGNVAIEDGSGSLDISNVGGEVRLKDGSGEIVVREVGSVRIDEDGSGGIRLAGVRGNVTVRDDGSGSISVRDVGGDFTVDDDGSGGIDHQGVRGRVKVPAGE